jgi:pyrroline-5-carboxylate reductase
MAIESGRQPHELRQQIASPGGTTVAALQVLEQHEVRLAVQRAVHRAKERSLEIAETYRTAGA